MLKGAMISMEIKKHAFSGTMESSDAYVEIEPAENGLTVELESIVEKQFGDSIRATVLSVLQDFKVENAKIRIADRGALECVIRARVETAVLRGRETLL